MLPTESFKKRWEEAKDLGEIFIRLIVGGWEVGRRGGGRR